jgi:hypothetical protein
LTTSWFKRDAVDGIDRLEIGDDADAFFLLVAEVVTGEECVG